VGSKVRFLFKYLMTKFVNASLIQHMASNTITAKEPAVYRKFIDEASKIK
jgi:hypothetical protein